MNERRSNELNFQLIATLFGMKKVYNYNIVLNIQIKMKSKILLPAIFLFMLLTGLVNKTSAQSGNLSIVNNSGTYQVVFTPTSTGPFTLGASALVALKANLGTFTLPSTVTDVTGGPWTLTSPKQSDATFDYWGFTTSGNTALSFTTGTPITLFTIPAPSCTGGTLSVVDPNNLPGGGSGIVNGFDFGTFFNSPTGGNIAGVSGSGVSCSGPLTLGKPNPSNQNVTPGGTGTGNALTDLAPSGGNQPYTYSQDTGATCIAPSGATALPTPVTVNSSTGAYSYTAPNTPGTYYFCIKVCDATTPTSVCKTATYPVVVQSVCAANAGSLN